MSDDGNRGLCGHLRASLGLACLDCFRELRGYADDLAALRSRLENSEMLVRQLRNVAQNWCRHSAHCDCNACETVSRATAFLSPTPPEPPRPGRCSCGTELTEFTEGDGRKHGRWFCPNTACPDGQLTPAAVPLKEPTCGYLVLTGTRDVMPCVLEPDHAGPHQWFSNRSRTPEVTR